jgi:uncharacterized protein YqjF (DUF2071 family)
MTLERYGDRVSYCSERTSPEAPTPARFHASYQPVGSPFRAAPESIEHWLTERYCLYTLDDENRVLRGEIHHPPWPLQAAKARIDTNTMASEIDIELEGDPLLHYAARQDVVFWSLTPAADDLRE